MKHRLELKIIISIVLLGMAIYSNALWAGFVWDDFNLVVNNSLIKSFKNLGTIFISQLTANSDYYRPMLAFSFILDHCLYKLQPWGYHLTSITLHILNAALVFLIVSIIAKDLLVSACCALLFIAAPFHSEAVTYISGRADLLAGVFILSAFLFYLKERYVIALLSFTLSLLSRESAVVFPLVVILYDLCSKQQFAKQAKYYFLFFSIDCAYIVLRITIFNFLGVALFTRKINFYYGLDFAARMLTCIKSTVEYLGIIFWPVNLHMEREVKIADNLLHPSVLLFFFIVVACLYLIVHWRQKRNLIIFGLLWFLILLLPQSGLIFPLVFAEHFLYLPSIGIFLAISIFLAAMWQRRLTPFFLGAGIVFYATLTVFQNTRWLDMPTFYKWTLRFSPTSGRVHLFLGDHYANNGSWDAAVEEYREATKYFNDSLSGFAQYKGSRKRFDESNTLMLAMIHYNLGTVLAKKNLLADSEREYIYSIGLNPKLTDAYNNLGCLYLKQGKPEKAESIFQKALENQLVSDQIYYHLGVVYAQKGNLEKARFFWGKALSINPDYRHAREALERLH